MFSRLNSYAVTAEVQALRVRLDTGKRRLQCKNRRLQYLNQLMPPGYFGMEEMAVRCPGLYHTCERRRRRSFDVQRHLIKSARCPLLSPQSLGMVTDGLGYY